MYDDIVVPTDGSDRAQAAVKHAVEAAENHDATIHAVNVIDTRSFIGDIDWSPIRDELMRKAEETTHQVVEEVEERDDESRENNIVTIEEVRNGPPSQEILDYCREVNADLIVMGSRGETEIEDLLIGSVAERVLEKSEIPILTVPGPE